MVTPNRVSSIGSAPLDDHRREDAAADGGEALRTEGLPIQCGKEVPWESDMPKSERQQPGGESDEEAGANQPAAPANLESDEDRNKPADQPHDQIDERVALVPARVNPNKRSIPTGKRNVAA